MGFKVQAGDLAPPRPGGEITVGRKEGNDSSISSSSSSSSSNSSDDGREVPAREEGQERLVGVGVGYEYTGKVHVLAHLERHNLPRRQLRDEGDRVMIVGV